MSILFQMASSPNAAATPLLTAKYRTRMTNRTIIDNFPLILAVLATWGSSRLLGQTFQDFFKNTLKKTDKEIKKICRFSADLPKLAKTTFEGLDVTFVCTLLPLLLDKSKDDPNNILDKDLQEQLSEIRKVRNDVMHEPDGGAVDPTVASNIENIAMKLLDIGGKMYKKKADEINMAKSMAKKIITDAQDMVKTGKEHQTIQCQALLKEDGLKQLREKVEKFKEKSPLLQQLQSYFHLQLCGTKGKITSKGILKSLNELEEQIIIIEGESGSGKTLLLREFLRDILRIEGEVNKFEGSQAFEIPLLIACRNVSYRTLSELWRKEFSEVVERVEGKDLIDTALGKMRILLLVDGLDEINENSNALVEDVQQFLKNHADAKCIFTARPHSVKQFEQQLDKEGLPFQTFKIEEIESKEEQLRFLKTACNNGPAIAKAYEEVDLKLKSPVLLASYSYSYSKDPTSVKGWTLPSHVMRGVIDYGLDTAVLRLNTRNIQASKRIGDFVLERISYISFCCLLRMKLTLGKQEINWLFRETGDKCTGLNVDTTEILSCFFPAISTDIDNVDFFHKSHQETFAVLHLYFMMTNSRKSPKEIFQEASENYEDICEEQDGALQREYEDEKGVSEFFRR